MKAGFAEQLTLNFHPSTPACRVSLFGAITSTTCSEASFLMIASSFPFESSSPRATVLLIPAGSPPEVISPITVGGSITNFSRTPGPAGCSFNILSLPSNILTLCSSTRLCASQAQAHLSRRCLFSSCMIWVKLALSSEVYFAWKESRFMVVSYRGRFAASSPAARGVRNGVSEGAVPYGVSKGDCQSLRAACAGVESSSCRRRTEAWMRLGSFERRASR